jgi:hypothetical protein
MERSIATPMRMERAHGPRLEVDDDEILFQSGILNEI